MYFDSNAVEYLLDDNFVLRKREVGKVRSLCPFGLEMQFSRVSERSLNFRLGTKNISKAEINKSPQNKGM